MSDNEEIDPYWVRKNNLLRTCGHAVSNNVALHVILRHSGETAMCVGAERTPTKLDVYNGAIVNELLYGI